MRAAQDAIADRLDYILYFAIAAGLSWQTAKWGFNMEAIAGAILAGLIALKAKRSKTDK